MNLSRVPRTTRRSSRGITLFEAVVATVVISLVAIAVLGALQFSAGAIVPSEPKVVAQQDVSNLQTDLQAVSMYDATPLSMLHQGQTITVTPSSAPNGVGYAAADTAASTIILGTKSTVGATTQFSLQYHVPQSATANISGAATISLSQRAPGTCAPQLGAKLPQGCPTP